MGRFESFCVHPAWIGAVRAALAPAAIGLPSDERALALTTLRERRTILRSFRGPADSFVDLNDIAVPLHASARDLRIVLEAAASTPSWDRLHIPRVRTRSFLLSALKHSRFRYALSDAGASAFCDVSAADSLQAISKENLRNVDRLRRRAERDLGPVTIEPVTDPSVATSSFDRFVAIEDAGWKGALGAATSLASDTRAQSFLREIARGFQEDGRARIDFLTIAGRDAAAQFAVRAGPTWFLLKIGYHPDFKDVGPGGILLKAFLEEMRDAPDILEVNLTTNPPWAARWHFRTEPVYHVYIYNSTMRGRLLYAARSLKELAKVVRDRYRAPRAPALAP